MRFVIIDGRPFLVSNGYAYPVEISEGAVTIRKQDGAPTKDKGRYSLMEIIAKLGSNISTPKRKKRATSDTEVNEAL